MSLPSNLETALRGAGVPGTYASMAVTPVSSLIKLPETVSSKEAAAALLQGMTAHYLVYDTYRIVAGGTVLIHAGAGGTGLLLIQLAKRLGARVLTTVSTDEKAALARGAGAGRGHPVHAGRRGCACSGAYRRGYAAGGLRFGR